MSDVMNGTRKAAILMMALGVETAVEVTKHLERASAYDVMRQAAKLTSLTPDDSRTVLTEFVERLPHTREHVSGKQFVGEMMKRAFGGEDPETSIDFLRRLDKAQLAEVVRNEHPQVAAFVLSYIQPDVAGALLSELTPQQQLDVAARIAASEPPQREVLRHLARSLGSRLNFITADGVGPEVGGVESLVRIMKGVGREVEQNLLEGFSDTKPELAEELKKNMFVFEDVTMLDDRAIQRLLKEVDGKTLALSLKRASSELSALIGRNLSERARNILNEDLAALGKVKVREVDKAQSEVVAVVRRLEETGEISLNREDEGYV